MVVVSSLRLPESSSSEGCWLAARLALREDWREVLADALGEGLREASREAALRETVFLVSRTWRRRSGMVGGLPYALS